MPEIAEVARIVHFIRKHLVGKIISKVRTQDDSSVYGKAGTSASEFQSAMTGKEVVAAGQQGKYFWMEMSSPPHPLMHFGMTGWMKLNTEETYYYREKKEDKEWPPKHWKFILEMQDEQKTEAAFVDFRRFGRVRLIDCPAAKIRKVAPLKENGPDPVIDRDIVTETWLVKKLKSKKIAVKALLLDQSNISGIGNWVGDEIMYHAKIHPEQYSNTLTNAQMKQLHKSIHYICTTAVDLLADSDQYPEDWLFRHRWSKGKKDKPDRLPNGEKMVFLTVGGRTSAVIPSVQKKTGPVTRDIGNEDLGDGSDGDQANGESFVKQKKASKAKKEKRGEELFNMFWAKKGQGMGMPASKPEQSEEEVPAPAKGAGRKRKVAVDETSTNSAKLPVKRAKGAKDEEAAEKVVPTRQKKAGTSPDC